MPSARSVSFCLPALLAFAACGSKNAPPPASEAGPPPAASQPPAEPEGAPPPSAEPGGKIVVGEDACTTDADCAPAICCHASSCVGAAKKPACGDAMCTMECRPGTIDCGGGCLCQDGRCAARLMPDP